MTQTLDGTAGNDILTGTDPATPPTSTASTSSMAAARTIG